MMMHMWMWFGYDLGEFMFPGLNITTRWSFALTWIALFFIALLFEASKVYLASVQREAHKKLYPYKSDERRNLLCDRERAGSMEPTTSRNTSSGPAGRCSALKVRLLVNGHQSTVFLAHNVVGYLLMLAVMVYNVHLLLAVVFGMMLGYFLFGHKLTRLQMQCFGTGRTIICTPECDDTAETSTPPLLDSANSSESDLFVCRTRTCIHPSHYYKASTSTDAPDLPSCHYGAKHCPSRVARAKRSKTCYERANKEDSPSVEDAQLLRTERHGCCKKKQEPPPDEAMTSHEVEVHESKLYCEQDKESKMREASPQISCCHNAKAPSESQEQIIQ
ncbi:unnamed protein product [Diatraea saccharalis]|uniref:Copper transport protein n=1 Tax=Diatraea saccharalis TaxID=40085 RepID=A0A9N9WAC0_9NEOP|nr:unnamed protein product [Diatraea saccharalis]